MESNISNTDTSQFIEHVWQAYAYDVGSKCALHFQVRRYLKFFCILSANVNKKTCAKIPKGLNICNSF